MTTDVTSQIAAIGLAMLVAAATGCAKADDSGADSIAADGRARLSEKGIGPIQAGMTVAQAEAALRTSLAAPTGVDSAQCRFVQWSGGPPGLRLMVERGVIVRMDVDSGSVETTAGARVGDTEQRVRELYGDRLAAAPHKYTAGRYLTVTPADPADSLFRLVFETDGQRVTRYRAGTRPQVEYVEGCG
jgi:hypothetical protein